MIMTYAVHSKRSARRPQGAQRQRSCFSSLSLFLPLSFFSLLLSSLLLIDRNVQRAGPKARKGSARAALSLFFLQYSPFSYPSSLHIISALRSPSLLLTGPESALSARKGSARAFLRVSLLFALLSPLFSSLLLMDRKLYARAKNVAYEGLSPPHFPLCSPSLLVTGPDSRQRAFGAQIG